MSQSAYFPHDLDHVIRTLNAYANSMSHSAYLPETQRLTLKRKFRGVLANRGGLAYLI